jgi:GNAT superfamily N-acetyltransferase
MFAPEDWDQLVADHAPPKVLLVATGGAGHVVGYTAAHPGDGEMFLLFVHPAYAGRGIGRTLLSAAHDALRAAGCQQAYLYTHEQNERRWRFTKAPGTVATDQFANPTSAAPQSENCDSSNSSDVWGHRPTAQRSDEK